VRAQSLSRSGWTRENRWRGGNEERESIVPSEWLVHDQPLAHAQYGVFDEAELLVKLDDFAVGGADLEIDLGAAAGAEEILGVVHDLAAVAVALQAGIDGEVIDPAAMAFVPGHDAGDQLPVDNADEKELGRHFKLSADIGDGIVVGYDEAATVPEGDDRGFVAGLIRSDFHRQF